MHDPDAAAMARRDAAFERGCRLCPACDGTGVGNGAERCGACHGASWLTKGGAPFDPDRVSDLKRDRDAEIAALYATGEYTQEDLAELFSLYAPRIRMILRRARLEDLETQEECRAERGA